MSWQAKSAKNNWNCQVVKPSLNSISENNSKRLKKLGAKAHKTDKDSKEKEQSSLMDVFKN